MTQENAPTPLLNQYLSIKAKYSDSVLFFRLGDFYEMFYEDAVEASSILDIALTSRNKGQSSPVPLCGVPYHACRPYIAKLLAAGKKVAICEQVEDPALAKGIVKREVVRVVTPGMVLDDSVLEAARSNYLVAVCGGSEAGTAREVAAFAYMDISTGEFRAGTVANFEMFLDELAKLDPKEILLPENYSHAGDLRKAAPDLLFTVLPEADFNAAAVEIFPGAEALKKNAALSLKAAGALWGYACYTQKGVPPHVTELLPHETFSHLILDEGAQKNLELASLLKLLNQTQTAMGARLLRRWLYYPLTDVAAIARRQDAVAEILEDHSLQSALEKNLREISDLERLTARIAMASANARDLVALARSLSVLPNVAAALEGKESVIARSNSDVIARGDGVVIARPAAEAIPLFQCFEPLVQKISATLVDDPPFVLKEGGLIRDGVLPELDELRALRREGKNFLAALEEREKKETGISSLKVRFNRVFGYYIEITHTHRDKIPPHYIRKQTLVNAERFITPQLKEYEEKILGAEEKIRQMEYELFLQLREEAAGWGEKIRKAASFLAALDSLSALAAAALQKRWVRPTVDDSNAITIEEGRHPLVEAFAKERFVPNDIFLNGDTQRFLIITGPNMAGKSTVMRQTALIVILAQIGSFVPAVRARIGVVDRIFTRVGASDRLARGESTFMVEMLEAAHILKEATARSLVIIDEIGRGTSTYDGVAIAWAVAEFLHNKVQAKTLFATHYHELIDLARFCDGMKNFNIAVKEWNDRIIFLRKLVAGGTSKSYGVEVAKLAGLPPEVIARAKEILARWEEFAREREEGLGRQMSLFSARSAASQNQSEKNPVLDELQNIDLNRLTPIQALEFLAYLKGKII